MTTQNNNVKLNSESQSLLKIAVWGGLVLLIIAMFSYSDYNRNRKPIELSGIEYMKDGLHIRDTYAAYETCVNFGLIKRDKKTDMLAFAKRIEIGDGYGLDMAVLNDRAIKSEAAAKDLLASGKATDAMLVAYCNDALTDATNLIANYS